MSGAIAGRTSCQGGRAILFTVKSTNLQSFDDAQIVVRSLDTGEQHAVAQGDSAQYLPTGHLVYARAGALYAVRFDAARLAVTGAPVKVADGIITHPDSGAAQVAISRTGTLVYAAAAPEPPSARSSGSTAAEPRGRSTIDRRRSGGRASPPTAGASRSSIDGAFSKLWVLDVERGTFTRASQLAGDQDRAAWMPDGMHVTFGADTTGQRRGAAFSRTRFDGTGTATLLVDGLESPSPLSWSPDGRRLLYQADRRDHRSGRVGLFRHDRTSTPFLQTLANESSAAFSPDGRWVAYVSDESGRAEVLRAAVSRAWHPTSGFGRRRHGAGVVARRPRALLCERGHALHDAGQPRPTRSPAAPVRRLFSGPYSFDEVTVNYDVAPDGQHFLVPRSRVDSAPRQLELVLNWFEDVKRLAPR